MKGIQVRVDGRRSGDSNSDGVCVFMNVNMDVG